MTTLICKINIYDTSHLLWANWR